MKVKFLFIYIVAGVAFVAVSLWAFLSNGRSAKALRYKYKLGGIMLTAWAMLSAASCSGTPPFITCYEPVVQCYDVAMQTDELSVVVKGYGGNKLKSGDVLVVSITNPQYNKYRFRVTADPENGDASVLAVQDVEVPSGDIGGTASFEMTLPATDYKGVAKFTACGLYKSDPGEASESETPIGTAPLEIL